MRAATKRRKRICMVWNCARPSICKETGYCLAHHLRWRKHGSVFAYTPIGSTRKLVSIYDGKISYPEETRGVIPEET